MNSANSAKRRAARLYVVSTTFLSGKSVRDYANALSDAWIPSGQGIVLAYDRASDAHAIAPTQNMWQTYPTPSLVEAFREAGSFVQDKDTSLEKRLIDGSRLLMKRINEAEEQRRLHNQLLPGQELWAALVFFALAPGRRICLRFDHRGICGRRDAANGIRYFFPQAEVAMRFGAPYGGGVIAESRISQRRP